MSLTIIIIVYNNIHNSVYSNYKELIILNLLEKPLPLFIRDPVLAIKFKTLSLIGWFASLSTSINFGKWRLFSLVKNVYAVPKLLLRAVLLVEAFCVAPFFIVKCQGTEWLNLFEWIHNCIESHGDTFLSSGSLTFDQRLFSRTCFW